MYVPEQPNGTVVGMHNQYFGNQPYAQNMYGYGYGYGGNTLLFLINIKKNK